MKTRNVKASGFGLVELMISIGLLSVITMGTAEYMSQQQKAQRNNLTAFNRDVLINQLSRNLEYPVALNKSASFAGSGSFPANTAFSACVNGTGGPTGCSITANQPLVLTDTLGNVVAGTPPGPLGTGAPQYYNLDGKTCNTGPDSFCGIQAYTTFTADCGGPATCRTARTVQVDFKLETAAGVKLAANTSLKPFSVSSISPVPLYLTNIGTPGQLPLWVTDNTLGDSIVTQYKGNIGVNTVNPQALLDVPANANDGANIVIQGNSSIGRPPRLTLADTVAGGTAANTNLWSLENSNDQLSFTHQWNMSYAAVPVMAMNNQGLVQVGYPVYDGTSSSKPFKHLFEMIASHAGAPWNVEVIMSTYTDNPMDIAFLAFRARGSRANPKPLLKDDEIGAMSCRGWNGSKFATLGSIKISAGQNLTGLNQSYMTFNVLNATNPVEAMRLDSTGKLGIGTSKPTEVLHVKGDVKLLSSPACMLGNGSGGTSCTSDSKLKEKVVTITGALNKLLQIRGVEFDWNSLAPSPGRHDIGVIAQEVEKVFPTTVIQGKDNGYKMVDYAALVSPLIEAFRELDNENRKASSVDGQRLKLYRGLENRVSSQEAALAQVRETEAILKSASTEMKTRLARIQAALRK